jgi:hypothetical protein
VLRAFLPNVLRQPLTLALTAGLALTASLADQARALVRRGLPRCCSSGATTTGWSRPGQPRGRRRAAAGAGGARPARVAAHRAGAFAELVRNALVVHAMLDHRAARRAVVVPAGRSLAELLPDAARVRRPGA